MQASSTSLGTLSALALALALAAACERAADPESAPQPAATPSQEAAPSPEAQATGIPSCDRLITSYERCLDEKVDDKRRPALRRAFAHQREAWAKSATAAAESDALAEELTRTCELAFTTAKQAMEHYGCEW